MSKLSGKVVAITGAAVDVAVVFTGCSIEANTNASVDMLSQELLNAAAAKIPIVLVHEREPPHARAPKNCTVSIQSGGEHKFTGTVGGTSVCRGAGG